MYNRKWGEDPEANKEPVTPKQPEPKQPMPSQPKQPMPPRPQRKPMDKDLFKKLIGKKIGMGA